MGLLNKIKCVVELVTWALLCLLVSCLKGFLALKMVNSFSAVSVQKQSVCLLAADSASNIYPFVLPCLHCVVVCQLLALVPPRRREREITLT